jgi:hypothetical protein
MTREWVNFTGADEAKLKELKQAFEDFNVQACFREWPVMTASSAVASCTSASRGKTATSAACCRW